MTSRVSAARSRPEPATTSCGGTDHHIGGIPGGAPAGAAVLAIAVFSTALWTAPLGAQEAYSLEDIMAAPFASALTASAAGDRIAWVRYERGLRNIWTAGAPDWEGRRLTSYDVDDGQAIGPLSLLPNGDVVYVRGGAENRQGEVPNPTSDVDGAERAIWLVSPGNGDEPVRLAEGSSPAVDPAGERIVYLQRGQAWLVRRSEGGEGFEEPERLFSVRGSVSGLAWSPDGGRLAFVSNRGTHSFVGIYDLEAERLTWVDPSLDRDGEPVWSPDGASIAFLRVPREGDRLPFAPVRTALPWSIRVANAATGQAREVWRAAEGPGSAFRGLASPDQLLWSTDGRIVFPWERTGWLHLYSVDLTSGDTRHLMPGEHEVEEARLAADGRSVVYATNAGDIDRRHLWEVAVDGGEPRERTPGEGIEWAPTPLADGALALLASGARTPAHAEVHTGTHRLTPAGPPDPRFPADRLIQPEAVRLVADDGIEIHGQLFLPPDREGPRPAVMFFHGGSRRQMLLGFHYRQYYHNSYALNQYLASRGYVVLSVNYRSGIGYGLDFREALDYGAAGASEYGDVLAGHAFLAERNDVDPARIGLWGGSYGGYLTALGLARDSDLFAAGVDIHGVHDWNVVIRNFVPSYQPERREAFARLAFESSPMADIDGWISPVLLIHGDDDRNVPFSESVDLIESLREREVHVEHLVFPDEVHGFLLHRSWVRAYGATADFFDRFLGGDGDMNTATDGAAPEVERSRP